MVHFTVLQPSLASNTLRVVHPDPASTLSELSRRVRSNCSPHLQLPTDNFSFLNVEVIIADCTPLPIVKYFHAAL